MTKETKLRLVSALNTFVSVFFVTFGGLIYFTDLSQIDLYGLFALLTSSTTVAVRAVLKEFTSGLTK